MVEEVEKERLVGAGGSSPVHVWSVVSGLFGGLRRALLLVDGSGRIVRASDSLDELACAGAHERALGVPLAEVLGEHLMEDVLAMGREAAEMPLEEGRRAFLKCPYTGVRLVSVTLAGLDSRVGEVLDRRARYLVVLRPIEEVGRPRHPRVTASDLVARSPAMLELVAMIEALHRSEATVLITGESGTGKEVVARALHAHSPRHRGPFVPVNCAALPSTLLESELFGHVKGSFTGAYRDRPGRFELAAGGTIFLDEIGDMPLELQVKLLRVLQERVFERLGEGRPLSLEARVIAATHVDLEAAVRAGTFREDLYYRLRVVPLHVRPLRERPEDIEPLAHHLVERVGGRAGRAVRLSPDLIEALGRYTWPGNVRELENALEYAVALAPGQTLHVEHLPVHIRDVIGGAGPAAASPAVSQWSSTHLPPVPPPPSAPSVAAGAERQALLAALETHRWNRQQTARALGISRTTLWRRMKKYGLG